MTIKRMDHVSVVVDDLPAAISFFTTLGMALEGSARVATGQDAGGHQDGGGVQLAERLRFGDELAAVEAEQDFDCLSGPFAPTKS